VEFYGRSGYEAFMAAQEEDDKNLASYQTRQYDKALKEFLNTFNMHIDQIELGKMTKKEVWEYMLARKNNFIAFLNKQGNVDVIIREALEAAYQQALERWRAIPSPPPAATSPAHQETNSVKSAPDLSPQNKW
jgi:hypothetical protein